MTANILKHSSTIELPTSASSKIHNINLFHDNIRSLNKNFDSLHELITSLPHAPDIVCAMMYVVLKTGLGRSYGLEKLRS